MPSAPFGFGGILGGGPVPDVQMPDGLPVAGGKGSPLVDAFLALQGQRIKDAVTAPRDAYTGDLQVMGPDGHPTAEAMDRANGLAGLAMTGSMPFKAPKGALRMFGGAEAHEDPLAALSAALDQNMGSVASDVRPISRVDTSAKSWDLYHGTSAPEDFARFDPNRPQETRTHSPGSEAGAVFLSPAADEAAHYAGDVIGKDTISGAGPRVIRATVDPGKTAVLDIPHLLENDPSFVARARENFIQNDAKGRTPTEAEASRLGAMFDDRHARMLSDFRSTRDLNDQLAALGYPASEVPQAQWGFGATGAAIQRAKEQGLDTAVLRGLSESNGGDQIVALTPGRVRSYYDPSQVLFNGGPAGGLAGLPALAASSDPKGPPVSSGLAPFGALSAADIARLMQQARPQVGDEDVPAAIPPGFSGFVPPAAPTMQPASAAVPAVAPSPEPAGPMQAPLRMFGSLPPQMPAQAAPDAALAPMPSLVGSQAPAMPARAPVAAAEDAPATPPPARPLSFGALPTPTAPTTTGSTAASSPASPVAPAAATEPSFLDRVGSGLRSLNANGGSDLLMSLGIGLMSTPGFGRGAAVGLKNYEDNEGKRAASELARAEYGLKAQKAQREVGALTGNAAILKKAYPNLSDVEAQAQASNGATVTEALKILRDSNYGRENDPAVIRAKAQAQAEGAAAGKPDETYTLVPETERAALGLPAGSYQRDSKNKISPVNPTGTTINMGGEKAYDAEVGKTYAKQFSDLMTSDRNAGAKLNSLSLMEQQMNQPGFYSGFGGEQVKRVNQLLGALGIKDPKAASGAEAVAALSNQVVLDQLGGSLGGGVSNPDRDFIVETGPGLGKTPEGNKQLIGIYRAMAQRQQQIGQMARDYAKANGGRIDAGFDEQVSRFANDNPLFPAASRAAQAQSDGVSGPTAAPGVAAPRTQADFDALPKGAMYVDPSDGRRYRKN
ncbi:hypothetical protein [Methylobacterium brachiatum]|uniref:hypothetical protein n=1 Tax=Methylobacterium brachiatum TaxID=269660 RepID=UPI000EFADD92|nr:hypothetical protein [Methylobacterium brachiatum]AYO85326.1 hypothetical protein EBB05_25945 [Methylobacterium brachiatum]